jgi:hypothetical protein
VWRDGLAATASLTEILRPCSSLAVIFVRLALSDDPSPPSSARSSGMREKEVAAKVLAISTICRRLRITGRILMAKVMRKTDFTLASRYPEPDGEFLNQSKTIIGAQDGCGNLSEGRRTTRVISVTV